MFNCLAFSLSAHDSHIIIRIPTTIDPTILMTSPPPPTGAYSEQHDHSLNHDHSGSSAQCSRQNSPTREALKLKAIRGRRIKCPPGMMKPFATSLGDQTCENMWTPLKGNGVGRRSEFTHRFRQKFTHTLIICSLGNGLQEPKVI